MRSIALHHPGHENGRTFALVSVAACLALAGAIVALIVSRRHVETRDLYVPIAHETDAERQLKMGWTELGAIAAADPPVASAAEPNQSLPPEAISKVSNAMPNVVVTAPVSIPQSAAEDGAAQSTNPPTINPTVARPEVPAPTAVNPSAVAVPPSAPARADVPCGPTTCTDGKVCCNASCGTCVEPGQKCSQAVCGMSASLDSVPCGPNTCNTGQICCNASCGTCVSPGQSCDTHECANAVQYPSSQTCGMSTCNTGSVCCNPSCGICAAPGEPCSQRACS